MSSTSEEPISEEKLMQTKKKLSLLFYRPREPTFYPKKTKDNEYKIIELSENLYTEELKEQLEVSRANSDIKADIIKVDLKVIPDIGFADEIGKSEAFSLFQSKHQKISTKLTELFLSGTLTWFFEFAAYCRDRINPHLFQYSFSVALQHRDDTQDMTVESAIQMFPDQFVDPTSMSRFQDNIQGAESKPIEIERNYTANDREFEQRLAYFREDIGVNLHHWHWHLVYPGFGPEKIVKKDRRGELFYYMHSQLLARYNVERFTNGLPKFKILDLYETIEEGYFPKIIRSTNNRSYPSRPVGLVLKDVHRGGAAVLVDELKIYIARIKEVIKTGSYRDTKGNQVKLDEETGIDVLGDLVEASLLSKNPEYYGSLHNLGHDLIAHIHDPDGRFREEFGVMGDVTTAMRDPLFYRWHGVLDSLWTEYKDKLPHYPVEQLGFDGVTVKSINIQENGPGNLNELITHWTKTKLDLGAGLDFKGQGQAEAIFTHLNHVSFTYKIQVTSSSAKTGTCRIFLGPKINQRGKDLELKEQRRLMIEMDKFTVHLKPGTNYISRDSVQSTVTVPFERTFRTLDLVEKEGFVRDYLCGCGFPHHMLLPRGTEDGTDYDIFVMISDYTHDKVDDFDETKGCNDAHSFCGLRRAKYPDKRSMGYPFDRVISAKTLQDFAGNHSNMLTGEVNIFFNNEILIPDPKA